MLLVMWKSGDGVVVLRPVDLRGVGEQDDHHPQVEKAHVNNDKDPGNGVSAEEDAQTYRKFVQGGVGPLHSPRHTAIKGRLHQETWHSVPHCVMRQLQK